MFVYGLKYCECFVGHGVNPLYGLHFLFSRVLAQCIVVYVVYDSSSLSLFVSNRTPFPSLFMQLSLWVLSLVQVSEVAFFIAGANKW